ncbi:MAG: zinc-ribbon domain-containing protein [Synergistaceae bacterium]
MKNCKKCSAEVSESAKFCSNCGYSFCENPEVVSPSEKKEWFFLKYWRGNYTLGESIAVYIIINIISNRLLRIILNYMDNNLEPSSYITWIVVLPFLLLNLFQVVGCWRSANKYRGKQIYRYLVYIFIVLSNLGRLGF